MLCSGDGSQFTVSRRTHVWQHGHRTRHSTHRRSPLWKLLEKIWRTSSIVNTNGSPDALGVMDVNPESAEYGSVVGRMDLPTSGDELHHFGWNACSAALCPNMPHPHVERRYLLLGGLRSSNIYVVDTKSDPRNPTIAKTIEAEEFQKKTGYSRPHTVHCGPDAIYMSALGAPDGNGPGGIFVLDHETFEVKGAWEADRGPQTLAYDFWWHLNFDTMITSEWGTPKMVESGVVPEMLLGRKYGHHIHVWDLRSRKHVQALDLGSENQMALELRPVHNPREAYGFVGVVTNVENLSGSIWTWFRDNGSWNVQKGHPNRRRAGGRRCVAAAAPGLWRSASADYRHQPVAG